VLQEEKPALYLRTLLVADSDETVVGYTVGASVQDDADTAWVLRVWDGNIRGKVLERRSSHG